MSITGKSIFDTLESVLPIEVTSLQCREVTSIVSFIRGSTVYIRKLIIWGDFVGLKHQPSFLVDHEFSWIKFCVFAPGMSVSTFIQKYTKSQLNEAADMVDPQICQNVLFVKIPVILYGMHRWVRGVPVPPIRAAEMQNPPKVHMRQKTPLFPAMSTIPNPFSSSSCQK